MYLYTDGISESEGPDGTQLDSEGLKLMLESSACTRASERLPAIIEAWRRTGHETHDDITLLLVELAQ